jgi:hypothetical protein
MNRAEAQSDFDFKYLSGYQGYFLSQKFAAYEEIFSGIAISSGLTLLKFFEGLSKAETGKLVTAHRHRFLTAT